MRRMIAAALIIGFVASAGALDLAAQEVEGSFEPYGQELFYTVQEGDTLWDLAVRYYDSAAMWPDLWRQNPHIENPHWIYPGTVVSIYENQGVKFQPAPPPPLPPLPEGERDAPATRVVPHVFRYTSLDQTGFITRQPIEPLGRLLQGPSGRAIMSTGDRVYLEPLGALEDPSQRKVGALYTVVRPVREVIHPDTSLDDRNVGTHYWVIGQVVIDKLDTSVMVGRVKQAYKEINKDDLLMAPREFPADYLRVTQGSDRVKGQVLVSEEHLDAIGEGHVVFIDQGNLDGVEMGQTYDLYTQDTVMASDGETPLTLPPAKVGRVIVLTTRPENSTCLVVESLENFPPGTLFQARVDD